MYTRQHIQMHVTHTIPSNSWRWTLGFETCRRYKQIKNINLGKAHFVGLYCVIILQCTSQKKCGITHTYWCISCDSKNRRLSFRTFISSPRLFLIPLPSLMFDRTIVIYLPVSCQRQRGLRFVSSFLSGARLFFPACSSEWQLFLLIYTIVCRC